MAEWVVGALAVAYEEADDRILLVAEELIVVDEDEAEDMAADPSLLPDERLGPVPPQPQPGAGVHPHRGRLVTSGRPLCRLCGKPIDPDGHACPRLN